VEDKADADADADKDKIVEETVEPTTTQTKAISEPEPEEEDKEIEDEEKGGKYLLLNRLFKFIRSKETPLNPVLAGYFSKLVTILINRK
jgi:hypothetical protein